MRLTSRCSEPLAAPRSSFRSVPHLTCSHTRPRQRSLILGLVRCYARSRDHARHSARRSHHRSAHHRSASVRSETAASGLADTCLHRPSSVDQRLCRWQFEFVLPCSEVMAWRPRSLAHHLQLLRSRPASFARPRARSAKTLWTRKHLTSRCSRRLAGVIPSFFDD